MKYIVGIDGGGTKTDFVACDVSGNLVNRIIVGPSNPVDLGIDSAIHVLLNGLEALVPDVREIRSIFAGISGGTSGKCQELLNKGLKEKLGHDIIIHNHSDAVNALNTGAGTGDGAVVVSGTGSVAYLRKERKIFRIGGYGYLLDKGGSGYDFGRDALYSALCDLDGRGEKTCITEMAEEKTGGIRQHLDVVYQKGKAYIASFAPMVFQAYQMGDKVAEQIIAENAREYAKLFNRLGELSGKECCEVVLTGSVFQSADIILKYVKPHLRYAFRFLFPQMPPVYGAVLEAAEYAEVGADFAEQLRERFQSVSVDK